MADSSIASDEREHKVKPHSSLWQACTRIDYIMMWIRWLNQMLMS